jgi:ABC-type nitrate/sulfonate/bicarbonate transport system permease component
VDHFMSALLFGIYSTPKAAIAPLIILVFGIGLESKVILVFLLAFFSFVVSAMAGVKAAQARHLDIARSFGASRWLEFRSVVLPSTFPFILTGLRIGVGRALVGVVVAEELAANEGIGHYIEFYGTFLDTSRVMLGVVILGTFGLVLGELVRRLEKRFEVWRPEIH